MKGSKNYRVGNPKTAKKRTFHTLQRAVNASLAMDGWYVVEHRQDGVWLPHTVFRVEAEREVERTEWEHLRADLQDELDPAEAGAA